MEVLPANHGLNIEQRPVAPFFQMNDYYKADGIYVQHLHEPRTEIK
jgi:hypothetical protein